MKNGKKIIRPPVYTAAIVDQGVKAMCGIVGAVSTRNIVPVLVQGLQRLEYRRA